MTASFMVASETSLYVIGTNGRVLAVDIANGEYQWGDDLGGRVGTAPIVTGNKMYVATGLQNLYGYKIQ
jgi:outer membrane protein assembly factor BamB